MFGEIPCIMIPEITSKLRSTCPNTDPACHLGILVAQSPLAKRANLFDLGSPVLFVRHFGIVSDFVDCSEVELSRSVKILFRMATDCSGLVGLVVRIVTELRNYGFQLLPEIGILS
jgi:hypothetical protein